jgi:hypothetical protein
LIAVLVGGCGGSESKPKPATDVIVSPGSGEDTKYGKRTIVDGLVRNGDVREVVIEADPWPFGSYRRVGKAPVDSDGNFTYRHRPRFNTRYRARTTSGQPVTSRPLEIFVWPTWKLSGRWVDAERHRFELKLNAPRSAKPTSGRYFFYIRPKGQDKFRRVGSAKPRRQGGRVVAVLVRKIPRDIEDFNYGACKNGLEVRGMDKRPTGPDYCGGATANIY